MFVPVFIMVLFDKIAKFFKRCFKKKNINKESSGHNKNIVMEETNENSKLFENGNNENKTKIE